MKIKNALKALEKKNVAVTELSNPSNYNRYFVGVANGYMVKISTQGEDISTMRVAGIHETDDIQSDYIAGMYWDSMPQIFRAMRIA